MVKTGKLLVKNFSGGTESQWISVDAELNPFDKELTLDYNSEKGEDDASEYIQLDKCKILPLEDSSLGYPYAAIQVHNNLSDSIECPDWELVYMIMLPSLTDHDEWLAHLKSSSCSCCSKCKKFYRIESGLETAGSGVVGTTRMMTLTISEAKGLPLYGTGCSESYYAAVVFDNRWNLAKTSPKLGESPFWGDEIKFM